MGKYNSKKESVKPTMVNFMGEQAFKLADKEELVSTVMTTFLSDSYYESESTIVKRILEKVSKVDPLFVAKLALYVRNDGNLRSVTHLLASLLPSYAGGQEWMKRFFEKIVVRPDDMSEILSAYASMRNMNLDEIVKIPNSMKKGFKKALESLDAYQIDKYKMENRQVSLIDLVRLFHPKGNTKNAEAFRRLVKGESLSDLYDSKILEKEMSEAGQLTKDATDEEKLEAKRKAIASVVENVTGMPIMNLIRNLRNILLYAPDKVNDVCGMLRTEEKILKSRLLPFRFATAYKEVEKVKFPLNTKEGDIIFEQDILNGKLDEELFTDKKKKVLEALEDAIQIACKNIPELEGNVAVLVDHSGSCRGDLGGSSKVSAFSSTTTAMIGNLFACMLAWRQENVYLGLFGDRLIDVPFDRTKKLLDFNKESYKIGGNCGYSTETGIYDFLRRVVENKQKIDNIVVFSDCQIGTGSSFTSWYGRSVDDRSGHFHELFKEFRKINPNAKFIVVNLNQSGCTSVFDKSQNILNIAGWSDKIFDVITSNSKGWDAVIEKIENIEI